MSGSAAQQEEYLNRLRSQVQMQTLQEMMNKMSEKCFTLCAGKRGNHLESSEATCVVNCMDRYMETMHVVSQAVSARSEH
jgi:import inner membrane translocase subunit TIM13